MKIIVNPVLSILAGILLCLPYLVFSQADSKKPVRISGVVVDSATHEPVADVHVWTNRSGVITDATGRFLLTGMPDDNIHFSHVNYHSTRLRVQPDMSREGVIVALAARVRVLDEVHVPAFYSEESFRQKILDTTPNLSLEQEIANENAAIMKGLGKYAPPPEKTDAEIFFETFEGPKGATILSSRPGSGLLPAIKEMVNPSKPPVRSRSTKNVVGTTINPFKVNLQKGDTTVTNDTVKVVRD